MSVRGLMHKLRQMYGWVSNKYCKAPRTLIYNMGSAAVVPSCKLSVYVMERDAWTNLALCKLYRDNMPWMY